jgi:nitrilase
MTTAPSGRFTLVLVQLASGPEPGANLVRIRELIGTAAAGADLVVLPENCLCLGNHRTVRAHAQAEDAWLALLRPWVCELRTPVLFGGIPVLDGDRVFNRAILVSETGAGVARYDKIHLFQLDPDKPQGVDETSLYAHGSAPTACVLNGWTIGLSICYDLRFPELYRAYAPADLLLCPAAFARETGAAHWELLLRARAVENQCYTAGASQCGANRDSGFPFFGHSLVADPWGDVVAFAAPECEEGVVRSELSRSRLCEVRNRLPALAGRRVGLASTRMPPKQITTD